MNEIVLFGAGKVGVHAIEHFGRNRIKYVIDNDENKWGKTLESIEIISFESYLNRLELQEYDLVIAVGNSYISQVESQVKEAKINRYYIYSKRSIDKVSEILHHLRVDEKIVLFGVDLHDIAIVDILDFDKVELAGISDFEDSDKIGKKIDKYTIESPLRYKDLNVSFLVLDSFFYVAADEYLKQVIGDEARIINPYRKKGYFDGRILVNPYKDRQTETTEDSWNASLVDSYTIKAVDKYVQVVKDHVPLFRFIEIETYNRCNGSCSFCPVSKNNDPRDEHKMSWELFKKIINNLADLNYDGELCTFSNNEPFLDERIIEMNAYAREKLPNARMHLYTNGTLLTMEKFHGIMKYLDELIIDNYQQELKLIKPVQEIYDYLMSHDEYNGRVSIVLRKPIEILTSRGGDAPNRLNVKSFPENGCALLFEQMIIRPDGKVSLCCNDPLGKNTLGDATKQTLEEIWYGAPYSRIRSLVAEGRENWEHCKNCDTFYIY